MVFDDEFSLLEWNLVSCDHTVCIFLGMHCMWGDVLRLNPYQDAAVLDGDNTILSPPYLHTGISYTGKTASLYWNRTQFISILISILYDFDDDVIKWKHFPRYWPFVRGIHRSPVNSPHKGQWRRCFLWSAPWINSWVNNREAGDLRRNRIHYGVTVMNFRFNTGTPSRSSVWL